MFTIMNRGELDKTTEHEMENLNSRLKGLWLKEHNEDGTHNMAASGITSGVFLASQIPNLDASKITTGTLALARIPVLTSSQLPASVAYKDVANTFTQNQLISKTRPELQLLHSGTAKARIGTLSTTIGFVSQNVSNDGTNWNLDDTSLTGSLIFLSSGSEIGFYTISAGANPRTPTKVLAVDTVGIVTTTTVNATSSYQINGTTVSPNTVFVRGSNFNDGVSHNIGSVLNHSGRFQITSTAGVTVIPFWSNGGAGVGWSWTVIYPSVGLVYVAGGGPNAGSFSDGSGTNTYTVSFSGATGVVSIQRTAGAAAYTVDVFFDGQ